MNNQNRKVKIAIISVISNTSLVIMKLLIGIFIGSVSIISEAIHSGVDLLASIIALFSVKTSGIPADKEHPYGHGKIENISGTIEALLIFVAAIWIIFESVKKFKHTEPIEDIGWGVLVMFISSVTNIIVSEMLFKVGRETDSVALQADAWHLRTDVYTSAGVMLSLALIWIFKYFLPHNDFYWLDPVAAFGVALLIIKAAYDLTLESGKDLLDVKLPEEELIWISHSIVEYKPYVHGFHNLRTRKSGHFRFVEFHIKVDPNMTVADSHKITDILSKKIKGYFIETNVTIHIEPCDGNCIGKCLEGCLISEEKRKDLFNKQQCK